MKLGKTVVRTHQVQFDELDAGEALYHINYLRICDQIRNAYYRELGFDFLQQKAQDFAMVIAAANARFLRPVQLAELHVATRIVQLTRKTARVKHAFFLRAPSADELAQASDAIERIEDCHFVCETTLVAVKLSERRSCEVPEVLKRAWE